MSIRDNNESCESPQRSSISHAEDNDEIWNMIITRLPTTALILREMEDVINGAQNLLEKFPPITHLHNTEIIEDSNKSQSTTVTDSKSVSIQLSETLDENRKIIVDKSIECDEFDTITINQPHKIDNLEEWNQFSCERLMEPSCASSATSFHSPSSVFSSSSSASFVNANSTTALDQVKDEKLMVNSPLYEIGKINALNNENVMKNYESTISMTKRAKEIIKNDEFTMPRIATKEIMLATIKPRIYSHVGDSPAINNLNQLIIDDTEEQNIIKSPRKNSSSPVQEKPSSIPRPIFNKPRNKNNQK